MKRIIITITTVNNHINDIMIQLRTTILLFFQYITISMINDIRNNNSISIIINIIIPTTINDIIDILKNTTFTNVQKYYV